MGTKAVMVAVYVDGKNVLTKLEEFDEDFSVDDFIDAIAQVVDDSG